MYDLQGVQLAETTYGHRPFLASLDACPALGFITIAVFTPLLPMKKETETQSKEESL